MRLLKNFLFLRLRHGVSGSDSKFSGAISRISLPINPSPSISNTSVARIAGYSSNSWCKCATSLCLLIRISFRPVMPLYSFHGSYAPKSMSGLASANPSSLWRYQDTPKKCILRALLATAVDDGRGIGQRTTVAATPSCGLTIPCERQASASCQQSIVKNPMILEDKPFHIRPFPSLVNSNWFPMSTTHDVPAVPINPVHLIQLLGPVRSTVALIALICLPLVFLSGADHHGWGIIPSQVVPGLVVLLVWALPFDILMVKVFMTDANDDEQARYRTVIRIDFLLILALILFWAPFFLRLFI